MFLWDGSHLGEFPNLITHNWVCEGTTYHGLTFPDGNILYCIAKSTENKFPFIVEEIKDIFDLQRRGIHGIKMAGYEYILFYVPITVNSEIVWETPLNRIHNKHEIRVRPEFRKEIQKILMFAEILSLTSTTESTVWIRNGPGDEYIPIAVNENNTTINRKTGHDFSILTKVLINKWFGEETDLNDIVKEMIHYREYVTIPTIGGDNRAIVLMKLRTQIEEIINKYDKTFIWYTYFIIDRIARHL